MAIRKNYINNMEFTPLTSALLPVLKPYCSLRPGKTYTSAPLDHYLYRYYYAPSCCIIKGEAVLMAFKGWDGRIYGNVPYCGAERLPFFFKLEEEYFNSVLGIPYNVLGSDELSTKILEGSGLLKDYTVREMPDSRDYLYDAEALRTLSGRKYSKKRNHINKFNLVYAGRWNYRSLDYSDSPEVLSFLKAWMYNKTAGGEGRGVNERGEGFDPEVELKAEYRGLRGILSDSSMYGYARLGGIFIDGRLTAFSMGDYNPAEKMAIISAEKADESVPGLYQLINREFLIHEYPDALLVNREDDVGIAGLRQSKLSYFPVDFAKKFALSQNKCL